MDRKLRACWGRWRTPLVACVRLSILWALPFVASTIAIGAGPAGAQPCAYLTTSGTVYVVDTSTHKVVTTVPVLVSRPALAISRTGERAYVTGAASGSDGGGRMYVLDTTENRVLYDVRIRYSSMWDARWKGFCRSSSIRKSQARRASHRATR